MSIFGKFRVAALGGAITLIASVSAFAQSTVLVVDSARVLTESQVGQHIDRQITSMGTTSQAQFKSRTDPLLARITNLETQMNGKTRDQIAADPALVSQIQQAQSDLQNVRADAAVAQREIQNAAGKASQLVRVKVGSILNKIAEERNADIIIDRQYVIFGEPADITATVISRLDAEMKTVPVVREKLPARPAN